MKKILFLFAFILTASVGETQMIGANYQMSIPFGKMRDYINNGSFRGANVEYHYFVDKHISVGGSIGWNVFYKDMGQYTQNFRLSGSDNIYTFGGKQYRYINTVPIMVNGRYHLYEKGAKKYQPYAGLSIGTRWTEYQTEIGQYTASTSRWQFAVSPEIGVYVPLNQIVAANVSISYNFATRAANGRVPAYNTLMFNVGLLFTNVTTD